MATEIDLVVGLIPISQTQYQLRFVVSLETRARHDIEDPVRSVPIICFVAASLNLQIVDVLRVNLRTQVVAILVLGMGTPSMSQSTWWPPAHVQHVVSHVRRRHIVCDHRKALVRSAPGVWAMSARSTSVVGVTESTFATVLVVAPQQWWFHSQRAILS